MNSYCSFRVFYASRIHRGTVKWLACLAFIGPAWAVDAPMFEPGNSISPTPFAVVITCATPGATLHYTTNGAEPTIYDPALIPGGAVNIKRTLTLKAKAWAGGDASVVTSADYTVSGDLSAGSHHVLAQKSSGEVYAWGAQNHGRLANCATTTGESLVPHRRSNH
jgi:hypothetical protein